MANQVRIFEMDHSEQLINQLKHNMNDIDLYSCQAYLLDRLSSFDRTRERTLEALSDQTGMSPIFH